MVNYSLQIDKCEFMEMYADTGHKYLEIYLFLISIYLDKNDILLRSLNLERSYICIL